MKYFKIALMLAMTWTQAFAGNELESAEAKPCREVMARVGSQFKIGEVQRGHDVINFGIGIPASLNGSVDSFSATVSCLMSKTRKKDASFPAPTISLLVDYLPPNQPKYPSADLYSAMGLFVSAATKISKQDAVLNLRSCFQYAVGHSADRLRRSGESAGFGEYQEDGVEVSEAYVFSDSNGKSFNCKRGFVKRSKRTYFLMDVDSAFDFSALKENH